jgi:hypothetical protein
MKRLVVLSASLLFWVAEATEATEATGPLKGLRKGLTTGLLGLLVEDYRERDSDYWQSQYSDRRGEAYYSTSSWNQGLGYKEARPARSKQPQHGNAQEESFQAITAWNPSSGNAEARPAGPKQPQNRDRQDESFQAMTAWNSGSSFAEARPSGSKHYLRRMKSPLDQILFTYPAQFTTEPDLEGLNPIPPGSRIERKEYGPILIKARSSEPSMFLPDFPKPCQSCFVTALKGDLLRKDGTRAYLANGISLKQMTLYNTNEVSHALSK